MNGDDLRWNKIFGAILATGLFILVLRQGSEMLFETKPPAKVGYTIAVTESAGEGGGAEAADTPPDWGTVLPTADVAAGATVANKCKSCHNFDNGGPNQTGPNLWGVEGRPPGSHGGFAYSSAMTDFAKKDPTWDYQHIYEFLKGPSGYIPGTKMSFVGLKKREDRINVIAWLRQQNSSPPAIPAPDPKAAEAAKAAAPADAAKPAPDAAGVATGAGGDAKPSAADPSTPSEAPAGTPTSGTTPAAGAAQQPSAASSNPGGGGPAGGAEKAGRKKQ